MSSRHHPLEGVGVRRERTWEISRILTLVTVHLSLGSTDSESSMNHFEGASAFVLYRRRSHALTLG